MIGHAEVGLVSCHGYKRCRHCDVTSEYINNHCWFCNFQKRCTYPCKPRTSIKNHKHRTKADLAANATQRNVLIW